MDQEQEARRQQLEEQYLGKDVRTERLATPEEAARIGGNTWGGEGVVVKVEADDEGIWFLMDWGMGWVITEDTTITVLGTELD